MLSVVERYLKGLYLLPKGLIFSRVAAIEAGQAFSDEVLRFLPLVLASLSGLFL